MQAAVHANAYVVSGASDTKREIQRYHLEMFLILVLGLEDMLPNIVSQLGEPAKQQNRVNVVSREF